MRIMWSGICILICPGMNCTLPAGRNIFEFLIMILCVWKSHAYDGVCQCVVPVAGGLVNGYVIRRKMQNRKIPYQ